MPTRIIILLFVISLSRAASPSGRVPVLLELFTSEGCSSCPPADRLLETLDRTQPFPSVDLVVLSEHVDYWDGDGWKDPFSSAELTDRQRDYGRRFHLDSVYTPQLVVDGSVELVGSRAAEVQAAVAKAARAPKTPVNLTVEEETGKRLTVHVRVNALPDGRTGSAKVMVAIADSSAESQVLHGENSGRSLKHVAVVRSLITLGSLEPGRSFSKNFDSRFPAGAGAHGMRIVAFVQDVATGRVLGVGQQEIVR